MNKATYATPTLLLIVMANDTIRTSEQAPDVFVKDPFMED